VDVRRQNLRMLLGAFANVAEADDESMEEMEEGQELTHFYLIAPFTGTVEQRLASDSQRVAAGTLLFAVANTDVLEVSADIREGDWQAVSPFFNSSNKEKKILMVTVPFVGKDREFEAEVDYVGRMVDPESLAVPLVALLDNSKHEFYPGMFARIRIPAGKAEEALIVPEAALGTNDNQKFVFIEDPNEPHKYKRVNVTVGEKTPEGVSVTTGLEGGERVVVEGMFLLKSELLLEREKE
jgi:membrane fusion protein, heavy metal efflux system